MDEFLHLEAFRRQIIGRPEWRDVLLDGVCIGGTPTGIVELTLGTLLAVWARGLFTLPADSEHRSFHVLRATCRPDRTAHRLLGFDRGEVTIREAMIPPELGISYDRFTQPVVDQQARFRPAPTTWTLQQVIAALPPSRARET